MLKADFGWIYLFYISGTKIGSCSTARPQTGSAQIKESVAVQRASAVLPRLSLVHQKRHRPFDDKEAVSMFRKGMTIDSIIIALGDDREEAYTRRKTVRDPLAWSHGASLEPLFPYKIQLCLATRHPHPNPPARRSGN